MCFRDIIKCEDAPTQLEKEVGSKGNESPEWKLFAEIISIAGAMVIRGHGARAYNWYDFVLDDFGEGDYVEEAGEVELG